MNYEDGQNLGAEYVSFGGEFEDLVVDEAKVLEGRKHPWKPQRQPKRVGRIVWSWRDGAPLDVNRIKGTTTR